MNPINEMRPSEFDAKYQKHRKNELKAGKGNATKKLIDDIPDAEKWRLIKESGLLDKINKNEQGEETNQDFTQLPPDEFLFDAFIYSIPFTTLFIVMDLLVLKQYGEDVLMKTLAFTFIKMFPAIFFLIYLTNKFRENKFMKMALLLVGIACGTTLMTLIKGRPILMEMKRVPGLSTLWIYSAFQLDFLPCLVGVLIPGFYYFYQK